MLLFSPLTQETEAGDGEGSALDHTGKFTNSLELRFTLHTAHARAKVC